MSPLSLSLPLALLATLAEQSGYVRTGRYDEVLRLCEAFAQRYPSQVACTSFGTSPEGRRMVALVASSSAAAARSRPVVLLQGGIHAGEIDGKDAGFFVLARLLSGKLLPGLLSRLTVVFVPVLNVDGHERMGPHNRPNQNGPREMGWRTTGQNLNLNRDYAKAETPEMAALLRLLSEWDPILYLDLHATDGAKFQHDVAVMLEPQLQGPPALRNIGQAVHRSLLGRLTDKGHRPLGFYPSFEKTDEPASGFSVGVAPPRFSTGYWPLRNRFAALVETHSWKDYGTRVRATVDTIVALLELAAEQGVGWVEKAREADSDDQRLGGTSVPLELDHTAESGPLDFLGFAYTVEPSPVSGSLRIRYDVRRPAVWRVPFYPKLQVIRDVLAPKAGYLVPPAYAALVGEKLRLHGLTTVRLDRGRPGLPVEAFRVSERKFRPEPYEGRHTVEVKGAWRKEARDVPGGSLFVPVGQRGARLLVHLLEPQGPDSLLSWGFFNAMFEQKEYMEAYIAEEVAEQMLARDPRLREEFARKLRTEPEFARDPAARLRFFHMRHPSWDERHHLYPILRTARVP